jgi:hypothetical protein
MTGARAYPASVATRSMVSTQARAEDGVTIRTRNSFVS